MARSGQIKLKNCPFCGGKFPPQSDSFRYCPLCGRSLREEVKKNSACLVGQEGQMPNQEDINAADVNMASTLAATPSEESPIERNDEVDFTGYDSAANIDEALSCYERYIQDKQAQNVAPDIVKEQATQLLKRLKEQIQGTIKITTKSKLKPIAPNTTITSNDQQHYSVVLKHCPNPDDLAGRLENVLLRGYPAIRLAVEKAPCIIVYKSKMDNCGEILDIFRAEHAAVSVVFGKFDAEVSIEECFANFDALPRHQQLQLQAVPDALWLGDQLFGVYEGVQLDGCGGLLVTSDHALYFLGTTYADGEVCCAVPLYRVSQVRRAGSELEIEYNDYGGRQLLTFDQDGHMGKVYADIKKALKAKKFVV